MTIHNNNIVSVEAFPAEIILEIHKHLTRTQREAVRRVCKLWCILINSLNPSLIILFSSIENQEVEYVKTQYRYTKKYNDDFAELVQMIYDVCLEAKGEGKPLKFFINDMDNVIGQIIVPYRPNLTGFSHFAHLRNLMGAPNDDHKLSIRYETIATEHQRDRIEGLAQALIEQFQT